MGYLITFLILAAGLLGILAALYDGWRAFRTYSWPKTEGQVISSRILFEMTMGENPMLETEPKVLFKYTVDGKEYNSGQVFFNNWGPMLSVKKLADIDELNEGDFVHVYYDPKKPSTGVLFPGGDWVSFIIAFFFFVGLAGIAIAVLCSI